MRTTCASTDRAIRLRTGTARRHFPDPMGGVALPASQSATDLERVIQRLFACTPVRELRGITERCVSGVLQRRLGWEFPSSCAPLRFGLSAEMASVAKFQLVERPAALPVPPGCGNRFLETPGNRASSGLHAGSGARRHQSGCRAGARSKHRSGRNVRPVMMLRQASRGDLGNVRRCHARRG